MVESGVPLSPATNYNMAMSDHQLPIPIILPQDTECWHNSSKFDPNQAEGVRRTCMRQAVEAMEPLAECSKPQVKGTLARDKMRELASRSKCAALWVSLQSGII